MRRTFLSFICPPWWRAVEISTIGLRPTCLLIALVGGLAAQDDLGQIDEIANLILGPEANLTAEDDTLTIHPRALVQAGGRFGTERRGVIDAGVATVLAGTDLRWSPREGHRFHTEVAGGGQGNSRDGRDDPWGRVGAGWRFRGLRWRQELAAEASRDTPQRDEAFELPARLQQRLTAASAVEGDRTEIGLRLTANRDRQREPSLQLLPGQPDHRQVQAVASLRRQFSERTTVGLDVLAAVRRYERDDTPLQDWQRQGLTAQAGLALADRSSLQATVGLDRWGFAGGYDGRDMATVYHRTRLGLTGLWDYREASFVSVGVTQDQVPAARANLAQRWRADLRLWHTLPQPWVVAVNGGYGEVREIAGRGDQWRWWTHVRLVFKAGEGIRHVLGVHAERISGEGGRDAMVTTATVGSMILL